MLAFFFSGLSVGGESYSNFLASTVEVTCLRAASAGFWEPNNSNKGQELIRYPTLLAEDSRRTVLAPRLQV